MSAYFSGDYYYKFIGSQGRRKHFISAKERKKMEVKHAVVMATLEKRKHLIKSSESWSSKFSYKYTGRQADIVGRCNVLINNKIIPCYKVYYTDGAREEDRIPILSVPVTAMRFVND